MFEIAVPFPVSTRGSSGKLLYIIHPRFPVPNVFFLMAVGSMLLAQINGSQLRSTDRIHHVEHV